MALKLGELVAYLKADDTALAKGIKGAEGKMRQMGDKARRYGPVLGAALAAGLGAGLVGGLELESARAKLAAQVGDPAMAEKLGKAAGAAYGRGFGTDATEAMTAARAVMQAGLLPKGADAAVIEDLTVKAQSLATVFGQDVTQTARAAGQMVKTGLAANAEEAFDILTRGFQVTGDQADEVLDTFSEYSTKFRDIGLSGQQAMGLMSQGLQAGARDADTVADALKEFSIRAIDGSKTTAEGFAAIGVNGEKMAAAIAKGGPGASAALDTVLDRLRNIEDPAERDAAAVALFGTKAEDLGDALYALDPSEATKALGEVGGAAGKMGDKLEKTASQKLESFKRKAQQALVEKLSEALPTIEKVVGWLDKHSDVIGPLATGLGVLAVAIGVILGVYKVWIALQTALNVVMMLNPIGLIVLAVLALIGIFILLWVKFEGFRDFWKKTWKVIKDSALAVGRWFRDTLWGKWIKGAWNAILGGGKKAVDWFRTLPGRIKKALSKIADFVSAPFKAGFNSVSRAWNRTVGRLSWTVPGWVPGVGGNTISAPKLPMLAKGGTALTAGAAIVGERGPELLHMPRGATVQPLASGSAAAGLMRLLLTGEFRIRGSDLVLVLRDRVALDGGDVQEVLGS